MGKLKTSLHRFLANAQVIIFAKERTDVTCFIEMFLSSRFFMSLTVSEIDGSSFDCHHEILDPHN
jgi:acyl-CoA thioesterase FadM